MAILIIPQSNWVPWVNEISRYSHQLQIALFFSISVVYFFPFSIQLTVVNENNFEVILKILISQQRKVLIIQVRDF